MVTTPVLLSADILTVNIQYSRTREHHGVLSFLCVKVEICIAVTHLSKVLILVSIGICAAVYSFNKECLCILIILDHVDYSI